MELGLLHPGMDERGQRDLSIRLRSARTGSIDEPKPLSAKKSQGMVPVPRSSSGEDSGDEFIRFGRMQKSSRRRGSSSTNDKSPLITSEEEASAKRDDGVSLNILRGGQDAIYLTEGDEILILKGDDESHMTIASQVFIPFLIAGIGMVGAGFLLDHVQHWEVFQEIPDIFIMIPALLGLKGNLEMTLASRLSTHANLGHMDNVHDKWRLAMANLALVEVQAIIVALLASCAASFMGWMDNESLSSEHVLLMFGAALVTASFASLILGTLTILTVTVSRAWGVNPDNVATPIAASLGDVTTLLLLSVVATMFYSTVGEYPWITPFCLITLLLSLPLWLYVASGNPHTRKVLIYGWTPVIVAMLISTLGGVVLEFAVKDFPGIAVFQPVMNGAGGNLAAVQVDENGRTLRVLLSFVIPGHLTFTLFVSVFQVGHTSITVPFLLVYLVAAVIQVCLLLYIGHVMIFIMWRWKIDPDNSAIPYITALGDFFGTGLLAVTFYLLSRAGDGDSDVGD
ncbi:unnamed protein product [Cyprideis torosa]|uniref:SLC41A/MgtE integral membrane domain-containing protein n=1 Tax=Cyprideis torosa TaxID=163714 RepID=A0A7R8ZQM2_9CRUS|nr:unnamed protein product [Cyprideis torosa]CAG0891016.1 unnamed protein product [Cyprideis torosa]